MSTENPDVLAKALRQVALRRIANRAVRALAEMPDPARRKRAADHTVGRWLSAAASDPYVCAKMKADIREWFDANDQLEQATKLAKLLAIAQITLREPEPEDIDFIVTTRPGRVIRKNKNAYNEKDSA
jgi:hypothetical protein